MKLCLHLFAIFHLILCLTSALSGCSSSSTSSANSSSAPGNPDSAASPLRPACEAGSGVDYEVGEGAAFSYHALSEVPWESLKAGDSVRIHWRQAPYREKILISNRGEATQPIRICGIPGPQGELPVIDGQQAVVRPTLDFGNDPEMQRLAVLMIYNPKYWGGSKPGHIEISGLEIRGARPANPAGDFKDGQGHPQTYRTGAASIYVFGAEHIRILGNTISDSGNGLFIKSNGDEENQSRDILVEGNFIHGNGSKTSDGIHNIYTEAIGITYQYNHIGRLRPGALGIALKDRSAGTVVRYNWIEGAGHLLDLVEPEDSAPLALADPGFHRTDVYGNILVNIPNPQAAPGDYDAFAGYMVHYGGDLGGYESYRTGDFRFYHNTVIVKSDQSKHWGTNLFEISSDPNFPMGVRVHVQNNLLYHSSLTPGAAATEFNLASSREQQGGNTYLGGDFRFSSNWVNAPWQLYPAKNPPIQFNGAFNGLGTFIVGAANEDPGFENLASEDFRLRPDSPLFGKASALGADMLPIEGEYVKHQEARQRAKAPGASFSIGAFEAKP